MLINIRIHHFITLTNSSQVILAPDLSCIYLILRYAMVVNRGTLNSWLTWNWEQRIKKFERTPSARVWLQHRCCGKAIDAWLLCFSPPQVVYSLRRDQPTDRSKVKAKGFTTVSWSKNIKGCSAVELTQWQCTYLKSLCRPSFPPYEW